MISLGIDIGGTGCKCVAFRDTGEQIAMSYREYPTKPGEVNLNALALRESVFFVISDCVKKLDDAKQIAAITGMSRVSVTRILKQFREAGILRQSYRRIEILAPQRLSEVFASLGYFLD